MARRSETLGPATILQAARRRFLQWGYSGTSTASLAEDLGITKAALYYHWADKEALFLAVVEDYLAEVSADLAALPPVFQKGDAVESLGALAKVFLSRHETSAQMQQLTFQESRHLSEESRRTLSRVYHASMVQPVARLLDDAAVRGWIRKTASDEPAAIWVFLGLMTAFLKPGHEGSAESPTSPDAFVRLFLNTLKGDTAC